MKFTINVKPTIYTKRHYGLSSEIVQSTKDEVVYSVKSGFCTTWNSTTGQHLTNNKHNTARVYNLEKRRAKIKITTIPAEGRKKAKIVKTKTPGHWVAYVYDFDIALLKLLNLELKQGDRTFKITKK
jgi:hypothetical protein